MEPVIDLLDAEWTALVELGATLSADEWATPTELPGWTVQDCYSHIVGIEHELLGRPAPPALDMADFPHLTALSSAVTEPAVHLRRGHPPAEVLDELREATAERLEQLRALGEDQWNEPGPTPVGTVPYREFMEVRTFDCWMHEQDVRRAVDRPGHQDGPVAEHAIGRCAKALGFVVGKKAGAPDGSTVVFDLQGPITREITVTVSGGRAQVVDDAPGTPTVRLTMTPETLWCLGGGRWDPDTVLADGRVTIAGDRALGEAVVRAGNFMI
jgi:uncharacterized protein (TIGR03083 family)